MLVRQRYGADVAILENRASTLCCSFDDGNRNEAGPYWGLMFECLLTQEDALSTLGDEFTEPYKFEPKWSSCGAGTRRAVAEYGDTGSLRMRAPATSCGLL